MILVGYQGMAGSHSERAALELVAQEGIGDCRLVPCVTSREVVSQLAQGRIDLGVVALRNAVGGEVGETVEALRGQRLRERARRALSIHHGLYGRTAMPAAAVRRIHSHEQALLQCAGNIRRLCPDAALSATDDTALAAQGLARGEYGEGAAVICSHAAGARFGLSVIQEPFQDSAENLTEFALLEAAR